MQRPIGGQHCTPPAPPGRRVRVDPFALLEKLAQSNPLIRHAAQAIASGQCSVDQGLAALAVALANQNEQLQRANLQLARGQGQPPIDVRVTPAAALREFALQLAAELDAASRTPGGPGAIVDGGSSDIVTFTGHVVSQIAGQLRALAR